MKDFSDDILDETTEENSELYEHFRIIVDKGQTPLRIDKFLMNRIENASRNKIQQTAKAGNIRVNDQIIKSNYKVKPEDIITVVFSYPPREVEIIPQDIPLDIIYEDEVMMVINKQAGIVVHPGHGNYSGTLLNALASYFLRSKSSIPENGFGYLVHRIDKDTSGLLIVAKDELTQTKLARQFYEHQIERCYQAVVWGVPEPAAGSITGHIGRSTKDRKQMAVYADGSYGKEALTHYKLIESFGYVSLVECRLETGRTHQIRVHMKYAGHPLFNDERYGGNSILKGTTFSKYKQFVDNCFRIIPRQALHAKLLAFTHPQTNKTMRFESDLPEDMHELVEKWRSYTRFRDED